MKNGSRVNPRHSPRSCAEKLKVLGDSTRLRVLMFLSNGAMRVKELNAKIPLEQSLLSHHLRVLREAGLVTCRRQGKSMMYSTSPRTVVTCRDNPQLKEIRLGCCSLSFS